MRSDARKRTDDYSWPIDPAHAALVAACQTMLADAARHGGRASVKPLLGLVP